MKKFKDESGNAAVESVFVLSITMFVICVLILFGFLFYQSALLQIIADDTSSKMGRTYAYECRDPDVGYISQDKLVDLTFSDYTYIFTMSSKESTSSYSGGMSHSDDKEKNECIEAAWYSASNLSKYRFMSAEANSTNVSTKVYGSEIIPFQAEIEVEISESYQIPLLRLLGVDKPITFKASSRALCTDELAYHGMLNFINEIVDYVAGETGISDLDDTISKITDCINTAFDVIDHFNDTDG